MAKKKLTQVFVKDLDANEKQRKHIILLDGTWNDETGLKGDGNVTNIVHLKRLLKSDEDRQIVSYHRGVGNDNDNGQLRSVLKGATGREIEAIVNKAYATFVEKWKKGDRIYIFGFSRGAATARLLASKINREGVPKSIQITRKSQVNNETNVVERVILNYNVDRSKIIPVEIEFLGVWDTVAALGAGNNVLKFFGLRKRNLFQNYDIAENIMKAIHLVAIDETRKIFAAALMNDKPTVTHEVWFPGVHSDVGGSYEEDEIAKVTLYYMLKCLKQWNKERGLNEFLINGERENQYVRKTIERANFHFHGKGLGMGVREIGVQENGKVNPLKRPKIHQLLEDIILNDNAYSIVEIKKEEKPKIRAINFEYQPFNLEECKERGYDIVN